jgi:hypothetical protein
MAHKNSSNEDKTTDRRTVEELLEIARRGRNGSMSKDIARKIVFPRRDNSE